MRRQQQKQIQIQQQQQQLQEHQQVALQQFVFHTSVLWLRQVSFLTNCFYSIFMSSLVNRKLGF